MGKTYNTTIHKDLTDKEYEQIVKDYYEKPSFEDVCKQLVKISKGGMKINHITNYYVKDLMAKTRIHFNNWTIEEALNHKPLMEFFAGKCAENKRYFQIINLYLTTLKQLLDYVVLKRLVNLQTFHLKQQMKYYNSMM